MCEFAPARLAREAQESFSDTMSLKPSCPAQWSFAPFCRNRKGLAREASETAFGPHGVHFLCAWIDITTPNPVSSVIADVPP